TAFRTGSVLATPNLGATIPNPLAIHQPRVPARTGSGSVTAPVFPNAGRPMTRKRWVLGLAALIVLLSGIVALLVLPDSPFHTLWSGSADHQRTSTSQATEADSGARQPLAAHPTAKASPATPLAGTRPVPVATPEPAGGAIELWRVGSPKDPDLPPAKLPEAVAELLHELQITVRVRALSAADFPVEFRKAIAQGAPPDLIAGNNLLPFKETLASAERKDSLVRCYGALQGLGTL